MRTFQKATIEAVVLSIGAFSLTVATPTTHVWGPSTDIQPYKLWHITSDLYVPAQSDATGGRVPTVTNVGLTVGVLPSQKINAEIGFDHKSGLGMADSYPLYGNAKLGIAEHVLGKHSPAMAIGIFDVGTKSDVTDYNVLYAKISKTVFSGGTDLGRLSVGYFSGNDRLLVDENGVKDNVGPMVAWERTMTEISDKFWLCFEYMDTHSGYGTWNVGGAWKFSPKVAVLLGYDAFNNELLANTATIQVDIDFLIFARGLYGIYSCRYCGHSSDGISRVCAF